jgi:peptide deformylase
VILSAKKLPKKCQRINPQDILVLRNIYDDLYDEMQKLGGNAYGLAAVQIGLPYSAFMVNNALLREDFNKTDYLMLFNASYYNIGEERTYLPEGCLSLNNKMFVVPRYKRIKIKANIFHSPTYILEYSQELTGINAIVYQHEIDHCNLITIDKIAKLEVSSESYSRNFTPSHTKIN